MIQIDMPMPTSCWCCPFSGRFDNFRNYCEWFPTSEMVADTAPRPEWCPLRDVKIMNDLISRQDAIDAFDKQTWSILNIPICKEIRNAAKDTIRELPFAQPEITEEDVREWCYKRCLTIIDNALYLEMRSRRHDSCDVCDGLEDGDTLYIYSEWDGGIGFDHIRDIHFCPKCGRRLANFESGKDGDEDE